MTRRKLTERDMNSISRVFGVTEQDSKIEAAEKGYAAMKSAGFTDRQLARARRMIDDAKARGVR